MGIIKKYFHQYLHYILFTKMKSTSIQAKSRTSLNSKGRSKSRTKTTTGKVKSINKSKKDLINPKNNSAKKNSRSLSKRSKNCSIEI